MAGGNFIAYIVVSYVNELVVETLENSPAFQIFAVRTSKRMEDISNMAVKKRQEIVEQMKDISKNFEPPKGLCEGGCAAIVDSGTSFLAGPTVRVHLGGFIDSGSVCIVDLNIQEAATEFAISLIQALVINNSKVISELHHLVDALAKLAARSGSPESLQQLFLAKWTQLVLTPNSIPYEYESGSSSCSCD